jgi:hypothetical protein
MQAASYSSLKTYHTFGDVTWDILPRVEIQRRTQAGGLARKNTTMVMGMATAKNTQKCFPPGPLIVSILKSPVVNDNGANIIARDVSLLTLADSASERLESDI